MYQFPAYYFHPRLPPRHCETREELLALLATDNQWRDKAYTEAERHHLRVKLAEEQEKERAATHAALVAEARHRVALQTFTALFKEGTQIIEGYRRAIVISPGNPQGAVYIELDDGSFQLHGVVPAENVLPDGSIRLPAPPTPLQGAGPSPLPQKNPQSPVLALTEKEWHALPPPSAAPTPVPDDGPQLHSESPHARGPHAHYTAWTNTYALQTFRKAAQKVRQANLPLTQKNLGKYLPRPRHRNTVHAMLRWHHLTLDEL